MFDDPKIRIRIGTIYPFGNPMTMPASKVIFNSKDYAVVGVRSYRPKKNELDRTVKKA